MQPNIEIPCPDAQCQDGFIVVYNAYSKEPLKGERQICDVCFGTRFVSVPGDSIPTSN